MLWPWQDLDDGAVGVSAIEALSLLREHGKCRSPRDRTYLVLAEARGRALLKPAGIPWGKEFPDCDELCTIVLGRAYEEAYRMGLRSAPLMGPVTFTKPNGNLHRIPFMVWVGGLKPVYFEPQTGKWSHTLPGKDPYFEP